jgi:hypothetical protein
MSKFRFFRVVIMLFFFVDDKFVLCVIRVASGFFSVCFLHTPHMFRLIDIKITFLLESSTCLSLLFC